jgi:hypothetical protein
MKVFLAGVESLYPENLKIIENGYNLISFFTMNKQGVEIIKKSRMFLLDSGAYTFLANSKKRHVGKIILKNMPILLSRIILKTILSWT